MSNLRIVRPDEATGHPDEVIDGATPVESVETDLRGQMVVEDAIGPSAKPPEGSHFKPTSVSDLIRQCNAACETMGVNNTNRHLIWNCAFALRQMVDRMDGLERRLVQHEGNR